MEKNANSKELLKIISGCLQSDRKSQELLYKSFYGFGMSICLRYTKTPEEAMEVLNDGFMKAFMKINTFDTGRPFSSWIKRIFVNTAIDFYRSNQKHYYHIDVEEVYDVSVNEPSAVDKLKFDDLVKLINTLPSHYALNFNLFAIEGYSHEQISKIMSVSIGTSKSNVSRARQLLRKKMENNESEILRL